MEIRRVIPVVHAADTEASRAFYVGFLGLEPGMDEQNFLMLKSGAVPTSQVIVAGANAMDPQVGRVNISVEVDDVDAAYALAQEQGLEIVYGPADEPWGVRRFFVRDPDGMVVNVAMHRAP